LADQKSAKSCVVYLTKKQNFRKVFRSRFCADGAQNQSGPAANNILEVHQISSKSVHFRRSYIAERVNIVETRHKVFPILGEASSPSKYLLSSNMSSTCPHNMVNFGPLAAEICWRVWSTPANFDGFRVLAALLHGITVLGVSQTLRR